MSTKSKQNKTTYAVTKQDSSPVRHSHVAKSTDADVESRRKICVRVVLGHRVFTVFNNQDSNVNDVICKTKQKYLAKK